MLYACVHLSLLSLPLSVSQTYRFVPQWYLRIVLAAEVVPLRLS